MNYTWSNPLGKIQCLRDSAGDREEIKLRQFFLYSFSPINMLFIKEEEKVRFMEESEQLMTVNYRIYDKIREMKKQVRAERMEHNLRNLLNPNLDESTQPSQPKIPGLIDDLEELDYDYDLQEDEYLNHGQFEKEYYSEDSETSEEKKSEDLWEDQDEETIEGEEDLEEADQKLIQQIQDEIKEEAKKLKEDKSK